MAQRRELPVSSRKHGPKVTGCGWADKELGSAPDSSRTEPDPSHTRRD